MIVQTPSLTALTGRPTTESLFLDFHVEAAVVNQERRARRLLGWTWKEWAAAGSVAMRAAPQVFLFGAILLAPLIDHVASDPTTIRAVAKVSTARPATRAPSLRQPAPIRVAQAAPRPARGLAAW